MTHTEMRATMERYQDFRRSADRRRQWDCYRADRSDAAGPTRRKGAESARNAASSGASKPTRTRPLVTPRWLYRLNKA